jgi:hypothetical protein
VRVCVKCGKEAIGCYGDRCEDCWVDGQRPTPAGRTSVTYTAHQEAATEALKRATDPFYDVNDMLKKAGHK